MSVWICAAEPRWEQKLRTALGTFPDVHSRASLPPGHVFDAVAATAASARVAVVLGPPDPSHSELQTLTRRWRAGAMSVLAHVPDAYARDPDAWPRVDGQSVPLREWLCAAKSGTVWRSLAEDVIRHSRAADAADRLVAAARGHLPQHLWTLAVTLAPRLEKPSAWEVPDAFARQLAVHLHDLGAANLLALVQALDASRLGSVILLDLATEDGRVVVTGATLDGRPLPLKHEWRQADLRTSAGAVFGAIARRAPEPDERRIVFLLRGPPDLTLAPYAHQTARQDPAPCGQRYGGLCAWPSFDGDFGPEPPRGRPAPAEFTPANVAASRGPDERPRALGVVCGPTRDWTTCPSVTRHEGYFRVLEEGDPAPFLDALFGTSGSVNFATVLDTVRARGLPRPVIWTDQRYDTYDYAATEDR